MLLQGNCSDKLSRLLLNKKDTWKVNVLSSTLSFAIRDFSCKSLKGCLVLIRKNKELFFSYFKFFVAVTPALVYRVLF